MMRGIYEAASGLMTDETWQRVLANNLAQMNTPGYLQEIPKVGSFGSVLVTLSGGPGIGLASQGATVSATVPDLTTGPVTVTGDPLNAAISGPGFFAVDTPQGTRYTRDGSFTLDEQGYLVTSQGYLVLNALGAPIQAGQGAQITPSGAVTAGSGGRKVGQIGIFNPGLQQITDAGGGLFQATGPVPFAAGATLVPGSIAQSNVSVPGTLAAMIQVLRHFEAGQQYVNTATSTLDGFIQVAE